MNLFLSIYQTLKYAAPHLKTTLIHLEQLYVYCFSINYHRVLPQFKSTWTRLQFKYEKIYFMQHQDMNFPELTEQQHILTGVDKSTWVDLPGPSAQVSKSEHHMMHWTGLSCATRPAHSEAVSIKSAPQRQPSPVDRAATKTPESSAPLLVSLMPPRGHLCVADFWLRGSKRGKTSLTSFEQICKYTNQSSR